MSKTEIKRLRDSDEPEEDDRPDGFSDWPETDANCTGREPPESERFVQTEPEQDWVGELGESGKVDNRGGDQVR